MLRLRLDIRNGHLMRSPGTFHLLAIHKFRPGPTLRAAQDHHGPNGPRRPRSRCIGLNGANLLDDFVQGSSHQLMHRLGLVALDEIRLPAVAAEQLQQFVARHASQHGGIGDLVAVQMQNRQHRTVAYRIQKLVDMPARSQRSSFRFAVSHHATRQQIRIVKHRAASVHDGVAELSTFVNRSRSFRRGMAGYSAWKRKLLEQLLHACFALPNIRVELAVRALEVGIGYHAGATVTGAGDVDGVQVEILDQAIEVDVDEVQPGRGTEMPQQARLDVLHLERLAQQRIGVQINLPDGKIIGGSPVCIHLSQFFRAERLEGNTV